MPLQATSGAASQDAFGGNGVAVIPAYIEEVFSCFLYTGNATARSIVNNIDISGNGGLVWTKSRSLTGSDHFFVDTDRGATKYLNSNSAASQVSTSDITAFNSTGYALNADINGGFNNNGATFASWTFRKQPKFFDVVTWTGTGTSQTITHALGSAPGCIMVKRTNATGDWLVYNRGLTSSNAAYGVKLNTTDAETLVNWFNFSAPTSTQFLANGDANISGGTYVAYLFAHNAGGFGLSGTDNVISCGSFTTSGTSDPNATVNLGYEPQWVMIKKTTTSTGHPSDSWIMYDTMRGLPAAGGSASRALYANTSDVEGNNNALKLTSVGFNADTGSSGITYIYIAIRRGPMKVPTSGTSVFALATRTGTGAVANVTGVGFPPDLYYTHTRGGGNPVLTDRLRGATKSLSSRGTFAEQTETTSVTAFGQDGVTLGANDSDFFNGVNFSGSSYINWNFRRAPGFFDVVCYKGTDAPMTIGHNLTVVPELIINKSRSSVNNWFVYRPSASATFGNLNLTDVFSSLGDQPATATTYDPISYANGTTYVSYLFATCAGVSKVGSYTGDGTDGRIIDCGFTSGARFVLIKSTSNTGNWWVWDTARGIVSGNDPVLRLNTTAAESTNSDDLDPSSSGFIVNYNGLFAINESGWSYIFLAIA